MGVSQSSCKMLNKGLDAGLPIALFLKSMLICGGPVNASVRAKMKSRALLNKQRKELHDILLKSGIDPAVTKWTSDGKKWTNEDADTLEAGLCHFLFSPSYDGTYSIYFKPGLDGGAPFGEVNQSWQEVISLFTHWASFVKEELDQEDPWQQYSAYLPPERRRDSVDNSPFTHREAEHITKSLATFQEHVKSFLPHYQDVAIQFDPQFERLSAQAKTGAGRIDWSNQFVGMLISLCITLSLAPDSASDLWKFWVQVIDGLLLP